MDKSVDQRFARVEKNLEWLWLIIGIVLGILLGLFWPGFQRVVLWVGVGLVVGIFTLCYVLLTNRRQP